MATRADSLSGGADEHKQQQHCEERAERERVALEAADKEIQRRRHATAQSPLDAAAWAALAKVLEAPPPHGAGTKERYARAQDAVGAIAAWWKVAALEPQHSDAWRRLGALLHSKGTQPGSLTPTARDDQLLLKEALEAHYLKEAYEAYEKAKVIVNIGSWSAADLCAYADLYEAHRKDVTNAMHYYRVAAGRDPRHAPAWLGWARLASSHRQDYAGSAGAYSKALALDPGNAEAFSGHLRNSWALQGWETSTTTDPTQVMACVLSLSLFPLCSWVHKGGARLTRSDVEEREVGSVVSFMPKRRGGRSGAITCKNNTMYMIQYCFQCSTMLLYYYIVQPEPNSRTHGRANTPPPPNWETDPILRVPFLFFYFKTHDGATSTAIIVDVAAEYPTLDANAELHQGPLEHGLYLRFPWAHEASPHYYVTRERAGGAFGQAPVSHLRTLLADPQARAPLEHLEEFKAMRAADVFHGTLGAIPLANPSRFAGDTETQERFQAGLFQQYCTSKLGQHTSMLCGAIGRHAWATAPPTASNPTALSTSSTKRTTTAPSTDVTMAFLAAKEDSDADLIALTCTLASGTTPSGVLFTEVLCCPVGTRIAYLGEHGSAAAGCTVTVLDNSGGSHTWTHPTAASTHEGRDDAAVFQPPPSRVGGGSDLPTHATGTAVRVRRDNGSQDDYVTLTVDNHMCVSAIHHAPGTQLAVTQNGARWQDTTVITPTEQPSLCLRRPSQHVLTIADSGTVVTLALNHANHYVPLLAQPDYEQQRGLFLAAALAEGATMRDGITGNTLSITDQLVEVGATTDTPEHRSLTDANAMALELLRTDTHRWNARQHGRHTARFFVIKARAGTGKTWFVRQMEHVMLHEAQAGRAAYLPLVMPVQRFAFLERASADTTGSLSAFDGM